MISVKKVMLMEDYGLSMSSDKRNWVDWFGSCSYFVFLSKLHITISYFLRGCCTKFAENTNVIIKRHINRNLNQIYASWTTFVKHNFIWGHIKVQITLLHPYPWCLIPHLWRIYDIVRLYLTLNILELLNRFKCDLINATSWQESGQLALTL